MCVFLPESHVLATNLELLVRGSSFGEGAAAAFFFRPALYVSSRNTYSRQTFFEFLTSAVLRTRSADAVPSHQSNSCAAALLALAGHRKQAGKRSGCRLSGDLILAQDAGLGRQLQWLCASRPLISGVATVITCIARHKALSRLAGAAVKQMAAHDGRDVHVSAHPAAQTPIDSGVCESFERSAW